MQNRSLSTTIIFVLLGLFIVRVAPTWIHFPWAWLNVLWRWICYLVGTFIMVFFICSLIYNSPLSWHNMLF